MTYSKLLDDNKDNLSFIYDFLVPLYQKISKIEEKNRLVDNEVDMGLPSFNYSFKKQRVTAKPIE